MVALGLQEFQAGMAAVTTPLVQLIASLQLIIPN